MLSTIKKILRKKTTYQVNDSKLKEKDEKSILKLASKIKGKKSSIAEELEKISKEKKQRILTTEVSKHRSKESTVTPLAYAIHRNSIVVEKMLRVAKETDTLKDILDATTIIKCPDGQEEIYTPLTYAILYKNSKAIEEILKVSKENGILKDILDATTIIKCPEGWRAAFTPLTYAILCENSKAIEEILKVSKENNILKDILDATTTIKYPNGRRVTFTPLAYAIHKDSIAVEKLLRVAKENGILKDILDATTTIKHSDSREVTYTPLAFAILRKDSIAVEKMLRVAKENSILKDILSATITIKHQNNQKATDKLLAALRDRKVIQKILDIARENDILEDILNATITIKYQDGEEKICAPLIYTISCQSNEVFNITRAINQDGQEKTHIPFPTPDKRETELKLKLREKRQKRQSRRDEGLNFNNGSSDKNVEIKVNRDILLQNSSGTENEINHTAVRNDVGVVKFPIESRVNVKAQNINATIVTSVILKTVVASVVFKIASERACVLSKPTTKLKEVAIACQGLALYL
ncbi:hypothetical protein H9I48_03830 [Wolbachia pipientis]|uniref:WD_0033/WD_0034 family tandem repeat-containing protein n=1 Tax=Wolbachia pipientis TaxID=955 RepID=UPI001650E611|nr:hypothetical protein [Wolbachia pipientis]MBC6686350.1 hypothetical protein [Wolbachia pipientis]